MTFKYLNQILKIKKSDLKNYYSLLQDKKIIIEKGSFVFIDIAPLMRIIKTKKQNKERNIVLQPNFELLVKPEIEPDKLMFLIQFAEIQNKDTVYKFIITRNSLHNAFCTGITQEEVKDFLKENISSKSLPHNIEYMINDVREHTGEIQLGFMPPYIVAEEPVLKGLLADKEIIKNIFKCISTNVCLLKADTNVWHLFFYLKEKNLLPVVDEEKIIQTEDDFQVALNKEEAEYFLAALNTLKEIGFEHHIKIDFNLLDKISDRVIRILGKTAITKAEERTGKYMQELKSSIKSYVLTSLKASLTVPQNLVLNKIAVNYEGDNPATTKKEIIKMIGFALKHKLKMLVSYHILSKKEEQFIMPKYLYDNRVLYFYSKVTKEEESLVINKIVFTALM